MQLSIIPLPRQADADVQVVVPAKIIAAWRVRVFVV
jgi:hypothetical protein